MMSVPNPEIKCPTPDLIREAYSRVGRERLAVHNFAGLEIRARVALAKVRTNLILEGLEGKNQAERDANLDLLSTLERISLEIRQEELKEAQVLHEMAVLALDSLKWQLRAYEATARIEGAEVAL